MRERIKELSLRFGRHLVSPITFRSLVAVAIIAWFAWTLIDMANRRQERDAELKQILVSSQKSQESISSIQTSWAKFDANQSAIADNQQRMLNDLKEMGEILKQERLIRETILKPKKTKRSSRSRTKARASCYKMEDRETNFGSAKVLQQVLVPVPCN